MRTAVWRTVSVSRIRPVAIGFREPDEGPVHAGMDLLRFDGSLVAHRYGPWLRAEEAVGNDLRRFTLRIPGITCA